MVERYVEKVKERMKNSNYIYDILGITRDVYRMKTKEYFSELFEILKTGSFTTAGIRLLRWLGIDDEEINKENLHKAVVIVKTIVTAQNKLASLKYENKSGI